MAIDGPVKGNDQLGREFVVFRVQNILQRDSGQGPEFKGPVAMIGGLAAQAQSGLQKSLGVPSEFLFQGFFGQGMGAAKK